MALGTAVVALSKTLLEVVGRKFPKYANAKVQRKKTVAKTAVVRDIKLALPLAPKRLPDPPLPNAAPMSAPLPCCTKINTIMAKADNI